MRVDLVTRIFSPEPAAAAFRLAAVANAIVRAGDEVVVRTGRIRDPRTPDVDPRVRISRWPVLRDASGTVRGYLPYATFDAPVLLRLLVGRRPDVVLVEPPPTTGFVVRLAAAIRRIPYVYYAADVWTDALESTTVPGRVRRIVSRIERGVLRRAALVVAVSEGVAEAVTRIAPGACVEVVPNGIDVALFAPEGDIPEGRPYLLYAGTTSEWQGADVFIAALAAVGPAAGGLRIVFLGQGSAWDSLRELARRSGADVEFRGVVPPGEAAAWLRGARASLVSLRPGQGYDFALPTKILASAAAGTPVLFSGPEGPAHRLVTDAGLGCSVAHDVDAVSRAIAALATAPKTAEASGRLRDWAVRNASIEATGDHVAALLRRVASVRILAR